MAVGGVLWHDEGANSNCCALCVCVWLCLLVGRQLATNKTFDGVCRTFLLLLCDVLSYIARAYTTYDYYIATAKCIYTYNKYTWYKLMSDLGT